MREQILKVEPFKSIIVLEYESAQEPNKHGTANLLAQISSEKEEEYLALAKNTTWFKVIAVSENGEEKILFCGLLKKMSIQKQSNSFIITAVGNVKISARTVEFSASDEIKCVTDQ